MTVIKINLSDCHIEKPVSFQSFYSHPLGLGLGNLGTPFSNGTLLCEVTPIVQKLFFPPQDSHVPANPTCLRRAAPFLLPLSRAQMLYFRGLTLFFSQSRTLLPRDTYLPFHTHPLPLQPLPPHA